MTTTTTTTNTSSSSSTPPPPSIPPVLLPRGLLDDDKTTTTTTNDHVPLLLKSNSNDNPSSFVRCHWEFQNGLLQLRSDEASNRDELLDVIGIQDVIGATLQMELTANSSTTNSSKVTSNNAPLTDALVDRRGFASLVIHAYPKLVPGLKSWKHVCGLQSFPPPLGGPQLFVSNNNKKYPRYYHPRTLQLAPAEDLTLAQTLVQAIRQLANNTSSLKQQQRRWLVVVNPRSGRQQGPKVAREIVVPLLEQASIDYDLVVTTHADHATELVQESSTHNIQSYDALLMIGGDGLVHQIINGLMQRSDAAQLLRQLALGVVGTGTCNGMATTLLHARNEPYGPLQETLAMILGTRQTLDAAVYTCKNAPTSFTSFLTYTYAMIADIDLESEVLHCLGEIRNDIWGALCVVWMRRYPAVLSYLPLENTKEQIDLNPPWSTDLSQNPSWITIEDDFLLVWASQVTHAAMHTHQAPNYQLGSGSIELMMVRDKSRQISRLQMARILLGLESGTHTKLPGVEILQCRAFRLLPLNSKGKNVVDGEPVPPGPIQAHVLPNAFVWLGGKNQ